MGWSSVTAVMIGVSGAVISGANAEVGRLSLLLLSVAVTFTVSPFFCDGVIDTAKLPPLSAWPTPIWLPLLSLTVTVLPASACPLTELPSPETVTPVGASGAVVSGAVTGLLALVLPAASVALATRCSPLVCGGTSVAVKLPPEPAVAVPIIAPPGARICTVLLGSAVPVT